jgi:hypothetical protein
MSKRFACRGRLMLVVMVAFFVAAGVLVVPAEAQNADPAAIRAQIAAGEFAPALAAAQGIANPQARDGLLAEIAQAQAQAGLQDQSLHTAGAIGDDRARAHALEQLTAVPVGGQGGAAQADFDSLIDLITSTVQPTTWDDVGGPGSIAPFPTGVFVDPQGILRARRSEESGSELASLRDASAPKGGQENVRQASPLRMISLTRLEKEIQLRLAAGRKPTEEMLVLAGLQRIQYVFVYPQSGDLVVAGPAGNWKTGDEDLIVSSDTGRPVVRLDDLVVLLRYMTNSRDMTFRCLITPRKEGLARVKAWQENSAKHPIQGTPAGRKAWLEQLRGQLGLQDIEVCGLDPHTRAARIIVEADYRMKLVAMGLENGVPGVQSYLASIKLRPGESAPAMSVLRWWFVLNYDAVRASRDHTAFEIRGQGVKVESENERLTAEGGQVHTGQSDELTSKFARSFTENFEALSDKYPIYGELRNVCDVALVASLVREEDMAGKVGWHMTCFGNPAAYRVELGPAPKTVQSVANYRVVNQKTIIAGVSGGVRVDPHRLVTQQAVQVDSDPRLSGQRSAVVRPGLPSDAWWWD